MFFLPLSCVDVTVAEEKERDLRVGLHPFHKFRGFSSFRFFFPKLFPRNFVILCYLLYFWFFVECRLGFLLFRCRLMILYLVIGKRFGFVFIWITLRNDGNRFISSLYLFLFYTRIKLIVINQRRRRRFSFLFSKPENHLRLLCLSKNILYTHLHLAYVLLQRCRFCFYKAHWPI